MAKKESISVHGDQIIGAIKQLIRLDIPVLLVGASSVGKSYSIDALAKKFKVYNQLLFIGSEKPENIEGLPRLVNPDNKTGFLEYFKPYWFPRADVINASVKRGQELFLSFVNDYYRFGAFNYNYQSINGIFNGFNNRLNDWGKDKSGKVVNNLEVEKSLILELENPDKKSKEKIIQINTKPFPITRELDIEGKEQKNQIYRRDDLRDICIYLSTLLGYGNFWLILDEIDKVEEGDIDKYAPLLHIVRERYLKGWKMTEINDGKGIQVGNKDMVNSSNYSKVAALIANTLDKGKSVMDSRIISIGNATKDIEEALFRRFIQIHITDMLVLERDEVTTEMNTIESCMRDVGLFGGELLDVDKQYINEINLQWIYNFFVKIVNSNDQPGNFFYQDFKRVRGNPSDGELKQREASIMTSTALYKILLDNFGYDGELASDVPKIYTCTLDAMKKAFERVESEAVTPVEIARKFVDSLADTGNSDYDKSMMILAELEKGYPAGTTTSAKDVETGTAKAGKVLEWVQKAYAYNYVTIFNKDGKVAIEPLNQYLLPLIQHLIFKKISFDDFVPPDLMEQVVTEINNWWELYILSQGDEIIKQLKGNSKVLTDILQTDATAKNYDGQSAPLYGSAKKGNVNNSVMVTASDKMSKYSTGMWQYLEQTPNETIISDVGHARYMREHFADYYKKSKRPFYVKNNQDKIVTKLDEFFKV